MKKLLIVVAVIVSIAAAWTIAYPMGNIRYRITVSVETPEGLKTGSAVREVYVQDQPSFGIELNHPSQRLHGEAVVVDLGKRGVLFALMGDASSESTRIAQLFPFNHGSLTREGIRHYINLKKGKATLQAEVYPRQYPLLVRFRDLNDPKTVEEVYQLETYDKPHNGGSIYQTRLKFDKFATAFGEGVKLKDIVIEMTDDKLTWGIEQYLPWLPQSYGYKLDGERFNGAGAEHPVANSLSAGAFSTNAKNMEASSGNLLVKP